MSLLSESVDEGSEWSQFSDHHERRRQNGAVETNQIRMIDRVHRIHFLDEVLKSIRLTQGVNLREGGEIKESGN